MADPILIGGEWKPGRAGVLESIYPADGTISGAVEAASWEDVTPIHFRDDDYWHAIADDFNLIATRVRALKPETAEEAANEQQGEPATA